MKTKKVVIFGTGDIAQLAKYYFDIDSTYEVVGFTVDKDYCLTPTFENLPLVPFDDIEKHFSPNDFEMFIALSYAKMNNLREIKYLKAKEMNYKIASYVSSHCSYLSQFSPGENAFILEDNTIQPYVKIGDNVTLWSGNHIGHHSVIENHNFISSHVVISGHCVIKPNCFIGVNATIGHQVIIAKETLVAAGAVIIKNTEEASVYLPARSIKLDKKSSSIKL
ncbi:acetyltransferase [Flavobacterium sp. HTF]|uniref:acetyltransferase n=1 Tax=Flavobacterium sp. HTF TaxID=2170732 RepID=UPI000D5DBABE|nr:acetyltransferase [Flavobacterium sp. HTF]PWB21716.1 sugar O-acyltransferase [Flavobacterium sp. HTF]